jgi:hypothetical protein
MDKQRQKELKAQYKKSEQDKILASLPMSIDDLKDLLSYLNRDSAPECDHSLKESVEFIESRNLDPELVVQWLQDHGGFCDCEVIYNVYDGVGNIVGWHLDEHS